MSINARGFIKSFRRTEARIRKKKSAKISQELREVLDKIRQALTRNPDIAPSTKVIARRKKARRGELAASVTITSKKQKETSEKTKLSGEEEIENPPPAEKSKPKEKPIVIRRIHIKKLGVSVGIISLGENGHETMREDNQILVNQDHPLYKKFCNDKSLFSLHLLRLITQEIVLMKKFHLPAFDAFEIQSKLLKDALV